MKRLRAYRELLVENLDELESLNYTLEARALTLRSDSDTLAVQAREIGYLEPGEGLILLKGFGEKQASYPMGKMLKWTRQIENRKPLFRGISLSAGIILFLLLSLVFPEQVLSRRLQHS